MPWIMRKNRRYCNLLQDLSTQSTSSPTRIRVMPLCHEILRRKMQTTHTGVSSRHEVPRNCSKPFLSPRHISRKCMETYFRSTCRRFVTAFAMRNAAFKTHSEREKERHFRIVFKEKLIKYIFALQTIHYGPQKSFWNQILLDL